MARQGFVYTINKGNRTFYAAIKSRQGVARFQKNGKGVWCSKKIADTFFEHTWNNTSREKLEAEFAIIEMYERLMPAAPWRSSSQMFDCTLCGAMVFSRNKHLEWHNRFILNDPAFAETLTILFGGK